VCVQFSKLVARERAFLAQIDGDFRWKTSTRHNLKIELITAFCVICSESAAKSLFSCSPAGDENLSFLSTLLLQPPAY
jgi:hypothetical protein